MRQENAKLSVIVKIVEEDSFVEDVSNNPVYLTLFHNTPVENSKIFSLPTIHMNITMRYGRVKMVPVHRSGQRYTHMH